MALQVVNYIGASMMIVCEVFGLYALFILRTLRVACTKKLKIEKLFVQMERIGVQSFAISALTGTFAGAVMALQTYSGFKQFGSENMIGPVVALTMTRELGPVLTGLMVAGRCGSGIAAEIGTMRITEQLDALKTLDIDEYQYLMVPRMLASVIIMPFLTLFSMFLGIVGGYLVCVFFFHLNGVDYVDGIKEFLKIADITGGLIKAACFGFILSSVGCFKGFMTRGGAKDVGFATTKSVVVSSIAILIANYFLAMLLFETT